MAHKTLDPHPRHAIESCTYQLHSWRPFLAPTTTPTSSDSPNSKPYSTTFHTKRPCLSNRATSSSYQIDTIDMSKLSLFEDCRSMATASTKRGGLRVIARKRRRRHGSRSVSGRSSDRSATRRGSIGASGAYATCSDFPMAAGTDSSGELFGNGDASWSDVSEARNSRKERDGGGERENLAGGFSDTQGNESGYGSEPGYRGDAEFGYGDEIDEEEDDQRLLFWGERLGDDTNMEMVGENTFLEQKSHHRCRRKKNDWRMIGPVRFSGDNQIFK